MRVGVLDIIEDTPIVGTAMQLYASFFRRQFVGLGPQFVSTWCRQLGHETHYATYWGQEDPRALLPNNLDIIFMAVHTNKSPLAYALAKLYHAEGVTTVVGGPHAKAAPLDCLRFFDIVVMDCDKALIEDILRGRGGKHDIVTSGRPLKDIPTVEERTPEITKAAFNRKGQPMMMSVVPMLASIGCPYTCNFCIDWNSTYVALPKDKLQADLHYVAKHWPKAMIGYHDPNFAIRFDETMDVIETVPAERRNRYIMESSLAILKEGRLKRLADTRCAYVAPGIESWNDYSNKAGVGSRRGHDKLEQVVRHVTTIREHVPGIQANFLFGTDEDRGTEPVELTKDFIRRMPGVWPTINIPTPFGGTPLFDKYLQEKRIFEAMPFGLYYNPYLSFKLANYDPVTYYGHLVELHDEIVSRSMLYRRLRTRSSLPVKLVDVLRTQSAARKVKEYRRVRDLLKTDTQFRAFHEGRSNDLPAYFMQKLRGRLGRYSELLSDADLRPTLGGPQHKQAVMAAE